MSAQAATGTDTTNGMVEVSDYRHVLVAIIGATNPNLTIKCKGSLDTTKPTITSAQTVSNIWDTVGMYDLQSGAFIAGDTGIVFTGTNDVTQYMVNTEGLYWLGFDVTAYAAGNVTVKLLAVTAQ